MRVCVCVWGKRHLCPNPESPSAGPEGEVVAVQAAALAPSPLQTLTVPCRLAYPELSTMALTPCEPRRAAIAPSRACEGLQTFFPVPLPPFLTAENEEVLKTLLCILKAPIPLEFNLPVMDLKLLQAAGL